MTSVGTIHFIRHGDTEASGDGVFCGDLDIPLAPSGVAQAEVLALAIGKWKVDAVYTSPKLRARMTAAPTCRALKLNPANAAILYNHRARVYHYQNQIELAGDELEKGLALEPRHPLLRTSSGYQQMRTGNLAEAIETLESVIRDDEGMRIAVPTLAMCYVQVGERDRAAGLLKDETLAAAEADNEMAYRLATYFAVEGDSSEALHWLRRAIYLGNENYPWFQKNPAWNNLRTNADFDRILEDLKKSWRKNQRTWKRVLEQVPPEAK